MLAPAKILIFAGNSFHRDLRSSELTLLLAAIIVAVTAITAVGFFTDRVGAALRAQASQALAADLVCGRLALSTQII